MDDQFTPEYIQFVLSDEAKALQEKWDKDRLMGYWVWNREIQAQHLIGDSYNIVDGDIWLPTLWDLLQIIEGAGWGWQRSLAGMWLIVKGAGYHWASVLEGDDVLAAAKLAVKAVGGRDDG